MYKLLLVDDEVLELETLRDYVDWSSMGIEVVATSKNGKEALALALEYSPDIIITDIKMPIMDGIEFSKKLRETDTNTKLIFLTGYDDFNYARNALNVRAMDYLLKPLNMDELRNVIFEIKDSLEKDKLVFNSLQTFVQNCFAALLNEENNIKIDRIITDIRKVTYCSFADLSYYLIGIYCKNQIIDSIKSFIYSIDPYAQIIVKTDIYVIIINSSKLENNSIDELTVSFKKHIKEKNPYNAAIIYSDYKLALNELSSNFKKHSFSKELIFYSGKDSIIKLSGSNISFNINFNIPSIEKELIDSIFAYNKEEVYKVINGYIELIKERQFFKNSVLQNIYNLLLFIWDNFLKSNPEMTKDPISKNELWKQIFSCEDIAEIKTIFLTFVEKILDYLINKKSDKNQYVVDKSIKFIKENFNIPITINDLSKEIYLSPNYIRSIFKEKTGETFLEYLTNFRLIKASELLKDKSLKVHDISNMVGYENTSYFCSIFAKKFGASPNDYRNKY